MITMYAEYTSLAYSAINVCKISNVINIELEYLSLNVAKRTPMLIGTKTSLQDKSNGELLKTKFKITEKFIEQKT